MRERRLRFEVIGLASVSPRNAMLKAKEDISESPWVNGSALSLILGVEGYLFLVPS